MARHVFNKGLKFPFFDQIKLNDRKPKQICEQCKQGLEFAYNLRRLGEANERRLEEEFQNDDDLEVEALEGEGSEGNNSTTDDKYATIVEDSNVYPEQEDDNVIIQFDGRTFKYEQGEIAEEDHIVYEVLEGEEIYEESEEVLPNLSVDIGQEETVVEELEFVPSEYVDEDINPIDVDDDSRKAILKKVCCLAFKSYY